MRNGTLTSGSLSMDECNRRDRGIERFGSAFMCGGDWLYKFPIGNGEQVLEDKCEVCPYFYPGVTMY